MKLKGTILILGLLMSMVTFAQPPGGQGQGQGMGRMDPAERVKRQTEQMVTDLGLNADQAKKVEAINKKYSDKQSEMFQANRDNGGDFTQMRDKMTALSTERTNELKTVLTADQLKKYTEQEEKRAEEMRQRRANGGQGGPGGPGAGQGTPPDRRGQPRGGGN